MWPQFLGSVEVTWKQRGTSREGMWQTYIKGGRILIYPPIRVGLAVGGVNVLRP